MALASSVAGNIKVLVTVDTTGLERELRNAERKLERTSRRLKSIGTDLSIGVTLPILGIGAAATKAFTDFETAMTGVAKTVDAPREQIDALGREFQALSEEIPVSANELARIGEIAGQLGVPIGEIRQFSETIAALGVSTNLSTEEAATGLARLSNVTNTSIDQTENLGSALVALGNNIEAQEEEILRTTTFFRAIASAAGASAAEILGLAGAIRRAGVRAQAGGSGIMVTIQEITAAVEGTSDTLETFARVAGTGVQEFATLFREDATEAVLRFIGGLDKLRKSGGSVQQVLEKLGLTDRRVARTLIGLSNASEKTREAVEIATDGFRENIALAEEAAKFYRRLGADFRQFANEAVNTAAELGRRLAPSMRTILDAARAVLDVFARLVEVFASLPKPIQSVTIGFAGLAALVGPVAFGLGQIAAVLSSIGSVAAAAAGGGLAALVGTLGSIAPFVAAGATLVGGFVALKSVLKDVSDEARRTAKSFDEMSRSVRAASREQLKAFERETERALRQARRRADVLGEVMKRRGLKPDDFIVFDAATRREAVALVKRFRDVGAEAVNLRGGLNRIRLPMSAVNELFNEATETSMQMRRQLEFARKQLGETRSAADNATGAISSFGDAFGSASSTIDDFRRSLRETFQLVGTGLEPVRDLAAELGGLLDLVANLPSRLQFGDRRFADQPVLGRVQGDLISAREERERRAAQVDPGALSRAVADSSDAIKRRTEEERRATEGIGRLAETILGQLDPAFRNLAVRTDRLGRSFVSLFLGLIRLFGGGGGPLAAIRNALSIFAIPFTAGGGLAGAGAGGFGGFPGFAHGGRIRAGMAGIVGEAGPELVSGPATVTPISEASPVNVSLAVNVDASRLPPAKTPFETARDRQWLDLIEETEDVRRQTGGMRDR